MTTCDFFPQNMATFAIYFAHPSPPPKKKPLVPFPLGFFYVAMLRKFTPQKNTVQPINFHKTDSPKRKQHENLSMSIGKVDKM